MIILDTNVLSEWMKPTPEAHVLSWARAQAQDQLYTTSVCQAEILFGLQLIPNGRRRKTMEAIAVQIFEEDFKDRILVFDHEAASLYAKLQGSEFRLGRHPKPFDMQIAAITLSHQATLATRNTKDFKHCGIKLVNPWQAAK